MATPDDHPDHGQTTGSGSLRCPECEQPARLLPPRDWLLNGLAARPGASHADGTPLCPVPGQYGSQPADPVGVPARLTVWQAVRQTWLAHPDWTVIDHLAWLDGEGYDTDTPLGDPADLIGRWLAAHRSAASLSGPSDHGRVYAILGADLLIVFDDADSAGDVLTMLRVAQVPYEVHVFNAAGWDEVARLVRAVNPALVIRDSRPDRWANCHDNSCRQRARPTARTGRASPRRAARPTCPTGQHPLQPNQRRVSCGLHHDQHHRLDPPRCRSEVFVVR
ncbi:hypothetical protein [Micromonospora sp. RP3T]|uniref:hypothetical protein n=1 Tax=Micromonospora sp. RP3T TaxID=2135446 RepID=UPI003D731596